MLNWEDLLQGYEQWLVTKHVCSRLAADVIAKSPAWSPNPGSVWPFSDHNHTLAHSIFSQSPSFHHPHPLGPDRSILLPESGIRVWTGHLRFISLFDVMVCVGDILFLSTALHLVSFFFPTKNRQRLTEHLLCARLCYMWADLIIRSVPG